MIIRSISLKHVADSDRPGVYAIADGATRLSLDAPSAAALPAVVMTLLFPEEVSATDLARLSGSRSDSAWRLEAVSGEGVELRIARAFPRESVVLELKNDSTGEWVRDCHGSTAVRMRLNELLKLPPPTVMEALNFWINTSPRPLAAAAPKPAARSTSVNEVELVATDDYFGNLLNAEVDAGPVVMSDDEHQVAADEYRRNRTIETVDDQMARAEAKLDELIVQAGAVIDASGEVASITRELSRLPPVRDLSDEDRAILDDPDSQMAEFERRLAQIDAGGELAPEAGGSRALWTNLPFAIGIGLTAAFTLLSILGGPEARRFAIANVVTLGVALAGFLNHVGEQRRLGRVGLREGARERRREQIVHEEAEFRRRLTILRDELPARTLEELDDMRARRSELEARLARVEKTHDAAYDTEEYKRVAARRDRAEVALGEVREARKRLGDATVPSFELKVMLERAGLDPEVLLWKPDPPSIELARQVKRLGQVASKYRLISERGLNPKTVSSWARVSERIVGRPLPALNMTPEHQIVTEDGQSALETFDASTAVAVVQALRMSLHLTLVKAKAPGILRFAIDVHPDRVADPEVRARLDRMYDGLGERLQVIVARSGS